MLPSLLRGIFGSRNDRVIKRAKKIVTTINALEAGCRALSDHDFLKKKSEFKARLQQGEKLDDLLPEAFALVREASCRTLGMRHFDVQLIGGIVLNGGNIAEMKTGEGKTLVATLPAYLNALTGNGVHIVTVNDYLTRRDAEWMSAIYAFLGMTTGVILAGDSVAERHKAYAADITYGTNNEFGFDYLRDNMALSKEGCVQRKLNFAIVDEVDSILIDEARTPLIISGAADDATYLYAAINKIVPHLKRQTVEDGPGDYSIDEKVKQAYLTETGSERIEQILADKAIIKKGQSLYTPSNIHILHHINAAIRAHELFNKDVDYLIKDGSIAIVDEFTGRVMEGRRWSDGLHQALEAKEGLSIQQENQTLATITYQNYFRLYEKLAGMTGTADTEAHEFHQIYNLEVMVVPTHKKMIRDDKRDIILLTAAEKFTAIVNDIKDCKTRNQPVLVGTVSIETSEYLSKLLNTAGIKHQVLNAKLHAKEAEIIAQAGRPGMVTIATNMAGRGTDIVLGGNYEAELKLSRSDNAASKEQAHADWQQRHDQVINSGGLHIIGTERHESRRVDNQLRGRSGRQGDPGSSRFYLSLEDDLMRIFASGKMISIMEKLGVKKDEAIESELVSRAIENAQRKVEAHNFDIRKHLLEFDDVANEQRKVIYTQRNELLYEESGAADIAAMREDVVTAVISNYIPEESLYETWDITGLKEAMANEFGLVLELDQWFTEDASLSEQELTSKLHEAVRQHIEGHMAQLPEELMRQLEKQLMLNTLDRHWKDHLVAMEHLRQGIHLRSFAAKNPKQEYKREAFAMFVQMLDNIKHDIISFLSKANMTALEDIGTTEHRQQQVDYSQPSAPATIGAGAEQQGKNNALPYTRMQKKIGRNEPCPCGSKKKYKRCCGA